MRLEMPDGGSWTILGISTPEGFFSLEPEVQPEDRPTHPGALSESPEPKENDLNQNGTEGER